MLGSAGAVIGFRKPLVPLCLLTTFLGLFLIPSPWTQYYLLLGPLLSLSAARCVMVLRDRFPMRQPAPAIAAALLAMYCLYGAFAPAFRAMRAGNDRQIEEIQCVMSRTGPDDALLDIWNGCGLFRPHVSYYWFISLHMRGVLPITVIDQQLERDLQSPRCRGILWDERFFRLHPKARAIAVQNFHPAGCRFLVLRNAEGPR